MIIARLTRVALVLFMSLSLSAYLQAANVKVNCNKNHATISAALKLLKPEETNVVTVSGRCKENVLIQGFDRLTLITNTSARIDDASGGTDNVVAIVDSRRVTVQGFRIKGGATGAICADASVCYVTNNSIQSSAGDGVDVLIGSNAFLTNNVIENNGGTGLTGSANTTVASSGDTYRGNSGGIAMGGTSYLSCDGSTVQNNTSDGVFGFNNATLRFGSCTITGNTADGIGLEGSVTANFLGTNVVTGNGGAGVSVGDLSFAIFNLGDNITGNLGGTDVLCNPQFSATRGALTNINGGITNCVEPAGGKASQDKSNAEIRHWESLVGDKLRGLRAGH